MGGLMSDAVALQEIESGIVQVTMQDRAHKNLFSPELVSGLLAAFAAIAEHPQWKAVVLTGYDTYFLSGGDHEGLLAIHDARSRFTDNGLYRLLLDCPLPVIAAMQGHGIGGGFAFGLFADLAVLARESVYTANFMRYGITPGMGATYIVPKKLGPALGAEMLFTARTYRGAELETRGIGFPVVRRGEVLETAMALAREIAEKPRTALVTLKAHLAQQAREELPRFIGQELAMHDVTFHQPHVRERIDETFRSLVR
jgi:polyketide biosynthesis enoyl-CoA hydratase PksI